MEKLVFKETVLPRGWGNETLNAFEAGLQKYLREWHQLYFKGLSFSVPLLWLQRKGRREILGTRPGCH